MSETHAQPAGLAEVSAELASLQRLHEISRALVREDDVAALYEQILGAAMAIMRSDFASIQLLYPERGPAGELRLLCQRGFDARATTFWEWVSPGEASSCGVALSTGQRVIVPDVATCDWMAGSEDRVMYVASGVHSMQTTPLIARDGGILGMLSTHWRRPHDPSERDLRLLDVLARQAADLIERTRVENALRANEARQAFLLALSDALRPLSDPAEIQAAACRMVGEHLDTDRTYYVELDDARGLAVVAQDHVRGSAPSLAGAHPMAAFSATLDEMRTGRPFVGEDAAIDPRISDADRAAYLERAIRSWVSVPLIKGGKLVAALCVTNSAPHEWPPREIALLEEVAERTWEAAERARTVEALREAMTTARRASQAKSEFLSTMSHELRTPLNAIAGYVQLMEMGIHGAVTDAQREVLRRIDRSGRHLLRLIDNVLNLARIEAGRVDYHLESVALSEVVAATAQMVEPQVASKGLTCDASVEPEVLARADRAKLQQILLNLLTNAIKFTPSGGRIAVHAAPCADDARFVHLQVSDTGCGIPGDKLDDIFQPFVQADLGRTRTADGVGLGLAISRDLARGMGGDLRVRSTEGQGALFTVALPAPETGAAP